MLIKLEKTYTREHSLFYCFIWNESNVHDIVKWIDMPCNVLFQAENKRLSVWYDTHELNAIFKKVAEKILSDKEYFTSLRGEFYAQWEKLVPLINNKQRINSIDDLKNFYDTFIKWWSPMAIVLNIPEMKEVHEDIRNEAFKMRSETQHYSDHGDKIFIEFFINHFPEYKDLAYTITPQEVFCLSNRKLSDAETQEIKKREKGYIVYKESLYLLPELESVLKSNNLELVEDIAENITEIKGTPACRGKVQGKVRLVLYKEKINTLEEGEILVTEMTAPDFVPAMKKSAAIITDEGGITCHAAIVSRELNKPCIIGTKIATKVLKDGDMVDVDAEQGIVRIIK